MLKKNQTQQSDLQQWRQKGKSFLYDRQEVDVSYITLVQTKRKKYSFIYFKYLFFERQSYQERERERIPEIESTC